MSVDVASPTAADDDPAVRVVFDEGSIDMPAAFEDRTSNVFVPADIQNQPNLSIARDWLREGEAPAAYIERQLSQLKSRLPGHKVIARIAERLGQGAAALEGERVDAQYRNGQQLIRQRQAVFLVAPRRALIFTASTQRQFDAPADALWRGWLSSFALPPAAGWPVVDAQAAAESADAADAVDAADPEGDADAADASDSAGGDRADPDADDAPPAR